MSTPLLFILLSAAALHAGWNALLKLDLDRYLTASLIQISAGLIALPFLLLFDIPKAAAWSWLMLSVLLHIGYNSFLSRAYQYGDLSQVYPLSRGSSPLLLAGISFLFLDEILPPWALAGLLILVLGISSMALQNPHGDRRLNPPLLICAFMTGAFIASYTMADAIGARTNADAIAYAVWLFAVNGLVAALVLVGVRSPKVIMELRPHWQGGLLGGTMSMMAYTLVIWAMTLAPIALVSALRETSVLFALLIGTVFLKESIRPTRVASCVLIAAGVVLIKVG
jgi:drug/metabolite transporter (DMT)-like permease